MSTLERNLVFFCLLLPCILVSGGRKKKEGSICLLNDSSGICKRVKNCPSALKSMKERATPGLPKCGFAGNDELICCPSEEGLPCKLPNSTGIYKQLKDCPTSFINKSSVKDKLICCQNFTTKDYCELITKEQIIAYHIAGGQETTIEQYPHMVALGYKENDKFRFVCGASIITNSFLLSAAHCITKRNTITIARIGATELHNEDHHDYLIEKLILHPEYDTEAASNDIVLIKLGEIITFRSSSWPACLYLKNRELSIVFVTGWGMVNKDTSSLSKTLREGNGRVKDLQECHLLYAERYSDRYNITYKQLCVDFTTGNTCRGDSGGPLQIEENGIHYVVGVTSFGTGECENGNTTVVFTNVSEYIEWIEKTING